jgi:hypothetical protein
MQVNFPAKIAKSALSSHPFWFYDNNRQETKQSYGRENSADPVAMPRIKRDLITQFKGSTD